MGMKIQQTIKGTFKNDQVHKMELNMQLEADGLDEDTITQMSDAITKEYDKFKDQKGISINATKKDNGVSFSLVADLDKMDADVKKELDLAGTSETYDQAKKQLEDEKYICK